MLGLMQKTNNPEINEMKNDKKNNPTPRIFYNLCSPLVAHLQDAQAQALYKALKGDAIYPTLK